MALSNAIAEDLATGAVATEKLAGVQRRREKPVRIMQRLQRNGHKALAKATAGRRIAPRWLVMLLRAASPLLRPVTARFVGIGIRPEHVSGSST
ncbi:hypothetical protein QFZ70_000654 [Arthrobacter sp. V1I9]|nr:hypothetical protein [Arthrobacter sp. V1I9]